MLSYQHAYHAGGPADIHKHVAFTILLDRLVEKDKPFVIVDLYAGHGLYDLGGPEAAKTKEFAGGIGRLWPPGTFSPPAPVARLLDRISALNPDGVLKRYPGSPALARAALRGDDQLILNELHPAAFVDLKKWRRRDARISVHKRDGLEALVGLTPPAIRRGVVLVDPSYEIKTEYADAARKVAQAVRKWPQGTYLIWYPVLAEERHMALIEGIQTAVTADTFICELTLHGKRAQGEVPGLRGTGVIVVNPPWQFDIQMTVAGEWLAKVLAPKSGKHAARWLKRADQA